MKQWWDITEEDQKAIMDNTEWCMADNGYFRGGGYSSRYETKAQMPATMIRLNLVKGLGPVLQIAEGCTVALPAEVSDKLGKRTDYTGPCTGFAPRCDGKEGPFKTAYDVMNNWGANHGDVYKRQVLRQWIWIHRRSKLYGDSTEQKDLSVHVLQVQMHRKDFRHSVSMDMMFRKLMTHLFRKTLKKNC